MSPIWVSLIIAFAPGTILFLVKLLSSFFGFSHIPHTHANLDIAVIHQVKNKPNVKIKIAYAGSNSLIVRKVYLTSVLSLASSKERFFAWFQVARGYLTDDWEGLQTVFGQKFAQEEPVLLRKTLNLILGILLSILIITLLYNPFGWIILFMEPYNNLKIIADHVRIKDIQTGENQVTPFLIKASEEREFLIDYTFAVKSRHFAPTEAKYIQKRNIPEKSKWKLPRSGRHVLWGKVKLLIKTHGILATYRLNLGEEDFILIPQKNK